jgi:prepilin-type N-terminal cleavage/methylation domain-containing protein
MRQQATRPQGADSSGFTLVELLVVIAIIGVLVALLLPAVQAAREAGRRTQCSNQMRQMALALQNHESARSIFPSGGIDPWPGIEDYASGGRPFAAPKQGLSWAFQILPYLEQNAVHSLVDSQQLPLTQVNMYFCPSRRGPTQNPNSVAGVEGRWLMDYAALVGAPTRSGLSEDQGPLYYARITASTYDDYLASNSICTPPLLWGGTLTHVAINTRQRYEGSPNARLYPTRGVIVRSSHFVEDGTGRSGNPNAIDLGLPGPTSFRQITDGSSNTIVLCEKRIAVERFEGPYTDDDAGWSDGWDYDTLRLAYCRPASDGAEVFGGGANIMTAGSSHTSVFFCVFADASVHGINYDIDLEMFNMLANKSDGEAVSFDF